MTRGPFAARLPGLFDSRPGTEAASVQFCNLARQPEGIAIAPDGNTAWVGSNRDSVVLVVNANTGAVVDTLRGFGLPHRMAIAPVISPDTDGPSSHCRAITGTWSDGIAYSPLMSGKR
jgi:hypothetical protein